MFRTIPFYLKLVLGLIVIEPKRKAFENFGAVGVDASIEGGDSSVNARALFPLVKDFVRNKCNIFIFLGILLRSFSR